MSEKMCAAPFSFSFFSWEYQNPRPPPKERGKRKDLQKTKERKTTTVQNPKRGGGSFIFLNAYPLFSSFPLYKKTLIQLCCLHCPFCLRVSLARSLAAKISHHHQNQSTYQQEFTTNPGQQIKYKGEGRGDNPRRINIRRNSPNRGEPSSSPVLLVQPFLSKIVDARLHHVLVSGHGCFPPTEAILMTLTFPLALPEGGIKDQFPAGCFCSAGFTCTVLGTG